MAEENQNPESNTSKKKTRKKKQSTPDDHIIDYSKSEIDSENAMKQPEESEINELLFGGGEIQKTVVIEPENPLDKPTSSNENLNQSEKENSVDTIDKRQKKTSQLGLKAKEKFQVFVKKMDQIKANIIEQMSAEQDKKLKIHVEDKMEPSLLPSYKPQRKIKKEESFDDLKFVEEGPVDLFKIDDDIDNDNDKIQKTDDNEAISNPNSPNSEVELKEGEKYSSNIIGDANDNDESEYPSPNEEIVKEDGKDKEGENGEVITEEEKEETSYIPRSKKIEASTLEFLSEQLEQEENNFKKSKSKMKESVNQSSTTIDLIQDIAKQREDKLSKREKSKEKYWTRQLFLVYQFYHQQQNITNYPLRNRLYLLIKRFLQNIKCNTEILEIEQQIESIENIFKEFTIFEEIQ